jgi:hypothetical protein
MSRICYTKPGVGERELELLLLPENPAALGDSVLQRISNASSIQFERLSMARIFTRP